MIDNTWLDEAENLVNCLTDKTDSEFVMNKAVTLINIARSDIAWQEFLDGNETRLYDIEIVNRILDGTWPSVKDKK